MPYQVYLMLPYVLSIVALVVVARRASVSAGADEAVAQASAERHASAAPARSRLTAERRRPLAKAALPVTDSRIARSTAMSTETPAPRSTSA